MAICHLLRLKSASHINRTGILRSRVLYSSLLSDGGSKKKPHSKKSELAKQQKAPAVESFVNEYMKEIQGVFPKATHVHNEVGGSWYNLKRMLQNVKENLMGRLDRWNSYDAVTSISDPKVCSDIPSHKADDNSGNEPQILDKHASHAMPSLEVQNSSSSVLKVQSSSSSEFESTLKVLCAMGGTRADCKDKDLPFDSLSSICGMPSNEDMVQETSAFDGVKTEKVSLDSEMANKCQNGNKTRSGNTKMTGKESNKKMANEELSSGIISVFKDGNSRLDEVSNSNSFLPSEATKETLDFVVGESDYSGYKNFSLEDNPFSQRTKMEKQSLLSDNSHDTADGSSDITDLMYCVKALPQLSVDRTQETITRRKSDHSNGRTAITGILLSGKMPKFEKKEIMLSQGGLSPVNLPKSGKKEGKYFSLFGPSMVEKNEIGVPFKKLHGHVISEDEETSHSAANKSQSDTRIEVLPLKDDTDLNKTLKSTSFQKESDQNKVILRFLPKKVEREEIINAFKDCGDISKVVISSSHGSHFRDAYIYFESDEAMKRALKKTDVIMQNQIVIVKAASSLKDVTRTRIPDLIEDPNIPTDLVKKPKQTIMITKLAHDIRYHQIEDALSFCGSKISQIVFGSSSTVAFVEFETEEGKEKALNRHHIDILGRRSLILRIDVPRTIVARFSNIVWESRKGVISLCKSFGKVRNAFVRSEHTMDVHFKLSEWPNMATILNRINGCEVEGQRLIAKPAPVYPPDVLDALWSEPEGRQHLRNSFDNLLKTFTSRVGLAENVDSLFEDRSD